MPERELTREADNQVERDGERNRNAREHQYTAVKGTDRHASHPVGEQIVKAVKHPDGDGGEQQITRDTWHKFKG
jgi:hypothetical protein